MKSEKSNVEEIEQISIVNEDNSVGKKSLAKNIIYSETDLVDKYKTCENIFSSKDASCLEFKNYIFKKIKEYSSGSFNIEYAEEGNSYIINNDEVEIDFDFYLKNIKYYDVKKFNGEDIGFFVEKFDFDNSERPKGASVIVLKYNNSRRKLKDPKNWNKVNTINVGTNVFHRGHILPGAIVDYIYIETLDIYKTQKSIFIQTKWSNANDDGQNSYNQFDLIEYSMKKYLEDSKCNGKRCIYMKARLIYSSESAIIPMGNHIQAKTHCSCGKCEPMSLNRFLPNITPDYIINYETGELLEDK